MEKNILKIDLDLDKRKDCINLIFERLSYLHDLEVFPYTHINKIVLGKKKSYNCKIYLNKDISEKLIIILQLILGSDWKKEVNTLLNHFVLKMNYSNRMFDIKRYPNGKLKTSKHYDITEIINKKIYSDKRKKNKN